MKNHFKDKKNIFIIAIILIILVVVVFIVLAFKENQPSEKSEVDLKTFKGQIINDEIKIPNTTSITTNEGEVVSRGEFDIKLQPQSESEAAYISKAKLTLKDAYSLSQSEATSWASDAKLIFIKSNGALGIDGKASSWQIIYGSAQKKRGQEIIVAENNIISAKEISTESYGYDLPINWYDSSDAISSLQLPQFKDETISAISFYYSSANDSWAYGLANGTQTTAMWVK